MDEMVLIVTLALFPHTRMAKKKKSTPSVPTSSSSSNPRFAERLRQFRLGLGIVFLFAGIFISFSLLSYIFTWTQDQDLLLSTPDARSYLFAGSETAANWGGRLGAYISHKLFFEGAGLASFSFSLWLCLMGIPLLYGKRNLAALGYIRWVALLLLLAAPLLSYLNPGSAFPYGGAWGMVAVDYVQGLLGRAGTGLALLAVFLFFVFVVYALDLRPWLRKVRNVAKPLFPQQGASSNTSSATSLDTSLDPSLDPSSGKSSVSAMKAPAKAEEAEAIPPIHTELSIPMEDQEEKKTWDIQIKEKPPTTPPVHLAENQPSAEEAPPPTTASQDTADTESLGLSFEVVQHKEEPVLQDKEDMDHEPYAPELDLPDFRFPGLDLLEDRDQSITLDKEELEKNKNQILSTLSSFGIEIQRISATVGPTVTLYEIVPAEGVRISKIRNLEDDIALNLAALGIRIIAPIPGKGTIGIEVPNAQKQIVSMKALLSSAKFANSTMSLPIALGKKIDNENYIVDLATMPHLLVAGATGQGKSVGINAILVSLLYKKHPSQLKFVLVDPKKVELSVYRAIEKHYLAKLPDEEEAIITDTKKVIHTLSALCIEMDHRYELLKMAGTRNIREYNEKFIRRSLNPEKGHQYLPFIVLVIDEFADLIMTAGKEVEMPIARLAQLARAVGIHLIIATQRPSVNVITGTIKANFPARIAFKVSAKVDSRTILDAGGAEQLIGRGDMLVSHGGELLRLQCAFVDTPEVEKLVSFIGKQRGYPTAFELPEPQTSEPGAEAGLPAQDRDELFLSCARSVVLDQSAATSSIQRRFGVGYARAGRIMDQLEAAGIVGPSNGSKPREVYISTEAELDQFLQSTKKS